MPSEAGSFVELDQQHVELGERFLLHQEHLVLFELAAARAALDRFAERLALHLRQEEELLLPHYAGTERAVGRDQVEIYRLEHRKLERLLRKLRQAVVDLGDRPTPRQLLALLERGLRFKHVLEHHGERERSMLYPALDKAVPPPERRRIVAACFTQWGEAGHAARCATPRTA